MLVFAGIFTEILRGDWVNQIITSALILFLAAAPFAFVSSFTKSKQKRQIIVFSFFGLVLLLAMFFARREFKISRISAAWDDRRICIESVGDYVLLRETAGQSDKLLQTCAEGRERAFFGETFYITDRQARELEESFAGRRRDR